MMGQDGMPLTERGQVQIVHKEQVYCESDEGLKQVAQGSCGCLIPVRVQGQVECGPEQPHLVGDTPAHGRVIGTRCSYSVFQPNPLYNAKNIKTDYAT